ncbi:hypothetical protein EI16_00765 [Hydrogenovibrio marinus]|uniref:Uncharacterized protein n=1 Tax=Hydrogenovibrio marinus TaxID=28885 RepID=A0A066ZWZ7_HYDMR|nr:hypothetical protein EI16_00765 [Hydrogenovibrio marinus]
MCKFCLSVSTHYQRKSAIYKQKRLWKLKTGVKKTTHNEGIMNGSMEVIMTKKIRYYRCILNIQMNLA